MKVINQSNEKVLATNVNIADNFKTRGVGLLNHESLSEGEALLIKPCRSIHSFGMKFRFDAVFIDKENKVVHIIENMNKLRVSPIVFSACSVLELEAFACENAELKKGDILEFVN